MKSVYSLINLLGGHVKFPQLMNMWMTGRVLRSDKLSKLQGKTIMLISGGCHQSSHVNAVVKASRS